MTTSLITGPLKINGVISTDKSVYQNLTTLANASGCFLTYDVNQGKWAVIINKPENSIFSFNDSNIVGSITVSETGVTELYNSAAIEFPHSDIRDQTDYVEVTVDPSIRYANEVDNTLNIQIDCINNPVQAQYLAGVELKQNRLNKIITFTGDYTCLGIKAGDVIDITNEAYGFTNKKFRIIKVEESDEDVIGLSLTGLEYDESIYDTSDLSRKEKTTVTGIQLREQNEEIRSLDDVDTGNQLVRLLAANAGAALLRSLFDRVLGTNKFGPTTTKAEEIDKLLSNAKKPALTTISASSTKICEGETVVISVGHSCTSCLFDIPTFEYDYEITGVFEEDVGIPLTGKVSVSNGSGSLPIVTTDSAGATSFQTMSITIGGLNTSVDVYDITNHSYTTTAASSSINEGQSVVITVNTTNVPNGTVVPYTITGAATDRISSPALTGTLTINSGTASRTIVTVDDKAYTGNQTFTFTIAPNIGSCSSGTLDYTATVTVVDNETAAPTTCEYREVPLVWCGVFNGADGQLQDITVRRYIQLPVPRAGEATLTVPLTVSVTKGNPSTINIDSTTTVAAAAIQATMGGFEAELLTSFNTVAPNGLITGTRTTVFGY